MELKIGKKTQMWVGVAALAGATYLLWSKSKNDKKIFANAIGSSRYKIVPPTSWICGANPTDPNCVAAWGNPMDVDAVIRTMYKLNDGYCPNNDPTCAPKQNKRALRPGMEFIGNDIEKGTFYNPTWNTKLKHGVVRMSGRGKYYVPVDWIVKVG